MGGRGVLSLLEEEIERPRSGPMRDIVATIQPEQDAIVRADLTRSLCVQGAPGTGKTALAQALAADRRIGDAVIASLQLIADGHAHPFAELIGVMIAVLEFEAQKRLAQVLFVEKRRHAPLRVFDLRVCALMLGQPVEARTADRLFLRLDKPLADHAARRIKEIEQCLQQLFQHSSSFSSRSFSPL